MKTTTFTSIFLINGPINLKLDSKEKVYIRKSTLENITQGLRNLLVKTIWKKNFKYIHILYFCLELELLKNLDICQSKSQILMLKVTNNRREMKF